VSLELLIVHFKASVVNVKMNIGPCKEAIDSLESQEELKDRLNHRKFQLIQSLQSQKYDESIFTISFFGFL
jgi:hypothetical protein